MTCKHLLNGAPDCVFCHRDQLKHELSLAEEGLANYQQENAELRRCLDGRTDCADERRQFRKALEMIRDGQIPQAMSPSLFAEFVLRGPVPQPAEHCAQRHK